MPLEPFDFFEMTEGVVSVPPMNMGDLVDVGAAASERVVHIKKLGKTDVKVVKDGDDGVGAFANIVGVAAAAGNKSKKDVMRPPEAEWEVVEGKRQQQKMSKRRKKAERADIGSQVRKKDANSDTTITGYDVTSDISSVDELKRPKMSSSPLKSVKYVRGDEEVVAEGLDEAAGTSSVTAGTVSTTEAVKETEKAKKEVAEA